MTDALCKLLSDQGLAISLVVSGLLGAAWVIKRFLGDGGIIDKWWSAMFGESGIARSVGVRWISLADHLQEATTTMLETQSKVVELQTKHDLRSCDAASKVCAIQVDTSHLKEAGLHACSIIEEMEGRLPRDQQSDEIKSDVRRIRELLTAQRVVA